MAPRTGTLGSVEPAPASPARRSLVLRAAAVSLAKRAASGFVASLPSIARALRGLGVLGLAFVVFVIGFGAMRHTTRQSHLDAAFRERVASGRAAGPGWRPLPGQAIATLSIPSIGLREIVVQDSTPELLQGAVGHLLSSPQPGYVGNSVILGRRITDGAPFRHIGSLQVGAAITVVTPQGAFAYTVDEVMYVRPGQADVFGAASDARLTLVTSGSWFSSRDRLAVVATLQGPPLAPVPVPLVTLRPDQLGQVGNSDALVSLLPWAVAFVLALLAWTRIRRRIASRAARIMAATPGLVFITFFLFENAARLLPGTV